MSCAHIITGHKIVDLWLNDKLKWFDLRKWKQLSRRKMRAKKRRKKHSQEIWEKWRKGRNERTNYDYINIFILYQVWNLIQSNDNNIIVRSDHGVFFIGIGCVNEWQFVCLFCFFISMEDALHFHRIHLRDIDRKRTRRNT